VFLGSTWSVRAANIRVASLQGALSPAIKKNWFLFKLFGEQVIKQTGMSTNKNVAKADKKPTANNNNTKE
jgi:hypothetical protein